MEQKKIEKALLAFGQINRLSADTINRLSADTINSLSADTINSLSADTINRLSAYIINSLSADTINSLSAYTINSLSAYTINRLSADTINSLSAYTINSLSADTINSLSADTINSLSADTINRLSADTINSLSAYTINSLSADTINSLSADTINRLSAAREIMFKDVPLVESPYSNLLEDINSKKRVHNQSDFGPSCDPGINLCGTQMCTAGHLVNMAGEQGYALQKKFGWEGAASRIHFKVHPTAPCQNFASIPQSHAIAYIEMMAAYEQRENKEILFTEWFNQLQTTEA
jgi:hypothetical protein